MTGDGAGDEALLGTPLRAPPWGSLAGGSFFATGTTTGAGAGARGRAAIRGDDGKLRVESIHAMADRARCGLPRSAFGAALPLLLGRGLDRQRQLLGSSSRCVGGGSAARRLRS